MSGPLDFRRLLSQRTVFVVPMKIACCMPSFTSYSQLHKIFKTVVGRSKNMFVCREYDIPLRGRYSDLTDTALDDTLRGLIGLNSNVGSEGARARLQSQGINMQRRRVRAAMERIDPAGVAIHALQPTLQRRTYAAAGPNSLWHIDGNHKLIR